MVIGLKWGGLHFEKCSIYYTHIKGCRCSTFQATSCIGRKPKPLVGGDMWLSRITKLEPRWRFNDFSFWVPWYKNSNLENLMSSHMPCVFSRMLCRHNRAASEEAVPNTYFQPHPVIAPSVSPLSRCTFKASCGSQLEMTALGMVLTAGVPSASSFFLSSSVGKDLGIYKYNHERNF